MTESCLRDTPGTSKSLLNKETLNVIEESRRARLEGKTGQYGELERNVDADRMLALPVSCDQTSLDGTRWAVNYLKNGIARGACVIYAEMLKAGGAAAVLWLHTLL